MGIRANKPIAERLQAINHALADGTSMTKLDEYDRGFVVSVTRRYAVFRALTRGQALHLAEVEDLVFGREAPDTATGQLF